MAEGDLTVHQAIVEIINEMGGVGKGDYNEEQKYWFRGIDAVLRELHPLFAKYGVFMAPNVIDRSYDKAFTTAKSGAQGRWCSLHVEYTVYGPTGDSFTLSTWGEGIDYSDKATNKAMTAAFKYALFQLFAICDPAEDGDAGEGGTQTQSEQTPVGYLIELLTTSGLANGVLQDIITAAIGRSVRDVNQLNDDELQKAILAIEQAVTDEAQLEETQ